VLLSCVVLVVVQTYWVPRSCRLLVAPAEELLRRLEGKHYHGMGDSTLRLVSQERAGQDNTHHDQATLRSTNIMIRRRDRG
jgi:hypothetical protein